MSNTHWRNYAASTVANKLSDPDHMSSCARWNNDGTRALMRFRGLPKAKSHMTPAEARALIRADSQWRREATL